MDMNRIKNKLRSETGASITFALLLFLVCAIISSVVIVAATASGGRLSQLAETDQRYYAVNSAAELLRNVLEEQEVVVTIKTTTETKIDQDDEIVESGTPTPENVIEPDNTTSFVTKVAQIVAGVDGIALSNSDSLTLAVSSGISDEATKSALAASITPIAPMLDKTNRTLILDVSNTKAGGVYTLRLTFKANITQDKNESTTFSAPLPTTDDAGKIVEGKYTRKKTEVKETVSTIRWKLIDLQTVIATASTTGGGE